MTSRNRYEHDTTPSNRAVAIGSILSILAVTGALYASVAPGNDKARSKEDTRFSKLITPQDRLPKGKHWQTETIRFGSKPGEYGTVWSAAGHILDEEGKSHTNESIYNTEHQIEDAIVLAGDANSRSEAVTVVPDQEVQVTIAVPDKPIK